MKINEIYSPNYNKRERTKKLIKFIVIHYTGMQSERESLKKLCSIKSKVSSHYLINKKGKIYRLVKDKDIAWHAGKSYWRKYKNLNDKSIGIELVNKGHQFGYENFSNKQILNLLKLCTILISKYKIKKENVVGHSDIAPLRKTDPGEKFPWKYLAKKRIGVWHNYKSSFLKRLRKIKISNKEDIRYFIKNLNKIGYYINYKNKFFFFKVVKAFQRHFRKELINGLLDQECLIISENLRKKLKKNP
jgi:N-acetylmuramoyl-L-alanine amidase